VHLERPDISIAVVRAALEFVDLLPWVQQHSQGLETPLNSAGTPLTTSQLRRLMVARAIVGAPEIVLLDEILDSMSDPNAARILQRIVAAEKPWTIVLVTNREKLKSLMDSVIDLTPVAP
jgi:putative ABC transport system ATP-binding protein